MRFSGLIFIVLLAFVHSTSAQECFDYYKEHCTPKQSRFSYQENKASVSFLFKPGEVRDIAFEMFAGKDYRITICAEEIFSDVIQLKLIRNSDEKVIYDNSQHNFNLNMEFYCPKSQETVIQIIAPEISSVADSNIVSGCIGIIVEEMISPKTGF